jgi:general secretion pathway protein D
VVSLGKARRRWKPIRSGSVIVGFLLVSVVLAACNLITLDDEPKRPPDAFDRIRSLDLLPRYPDPPEREPRGAARQQGAVYYGAGAPMLERVDAAEQARAATAGEGYALNFEDTPITTVAKVVLGDILGVGYTIDPRVRGTISLASGRPVPKADILYVLENALRISNVALVRDAAGYRLVPLADAVGAGNIDAQSALAEPGYGISVVPLHYVSAQTLIKLLDTFATRPGMVRADPARNMLLIQGSGAERRTAIETILSFDAEWMRGQSVGVFPVRNSPPEPVITELEKIVDSGEGGLSQNLIKFQAIARMNAILVVTQRPQLLKSAATWIARLDRGGSGRNVHVYRLRYGDARQVAKVLNDIFLGASASGTLESATNQIAPGSGAVATSSGDQSSNRFGSSFGSNSSGSSFGSSSSGSSFGSSASSSSNDRVRQQLGIPPPNQRNGPAAADASAAPAAGPVGDTSSAPVLSGVRITADVVNNSLLIFASEENYATIERAVQQIDRPQLQVAIDATIAEVTLTNDLNYGVQFFLTSHNLALPGDSGSALNTNSPAAPAVDASGVVGALITRSFPGFNFLIGPEAQPHLILDALHAVTTVKVLSNPSLVVIDNQPAILQVGDQVPISTGSATVLTTSNTIVNTIDYRDTGIILRVIPRINVNGIVRLDIEQEISNVPPTSAGSLTPTVSERRVKSSISVATGQTVLLAGLISEQQNGARNTIPVLDQIPGLGDAFGHQTNSTQRTELIIFIRPQIIRDGSDAHVVAEELRSKLRGSIATTNTNAAITTSFH